MSRFKLSLLMQWVALSAIMVHMMVPHHHEWELPNPTSKHWEIRQPDSAPAPIGSVDLGYGHLKSFKPRQSPTFDAIPPLEFKLEAPEHNPDNAPKTCREVPVFSNRTLRLQGLRAPPTFLS